MDGPWEIKQKNFMFQGMVQAAVYIRKKIKDEMLLSRAFGRDLVSIMYNSSSELEQPGIS